MKPIRYLIVAGLLLSASVSAEVFWSVEGEDGQQNWLLGTVHSEDPRLLEFPGPLMEALKSADRLALELVPDGSMLETLQEAMRDPERPLDELLETGVYERVVEIMEENYGMGEPAVRRMRPWAVAMTISIPPPETGLFMDLALSFRASGLELDVVALETVEEQLDFLGAMSLEQQVQLVRHAVEEYDQLPELFESLVSAYLEGDLDRLERLADEQLAGLGEDLVDHFNKAGLAERNRKMLDRAEKYLQEGGLIIAVGALHLPGEDGMIAILRERGYTVEGIY